MTETDIGVGELRVPRSGHRPAGSRGTSGTVSQRESNASALSLVVRSAIVYYSMVIRSAERFSSVQFPLQHVFRIRTEVWSRGGENVRCRASRLDTLCKGIVV